MRSSNTAEQLHPTAREQIESAVVRFAGDSGDGMHLRCRTPLVELWPAATSCSMEVLNEPSLRVRPWRSSGCWSIGMPMRAPISFAFANQSQQLFAFLVRQIYPLLDLHVSLPL